MGSSSAMVSAGPRPGSTPMAVPRNVPSSANIKLWAVSATAKPSASDASVSILEKRLDRPGADIDAEAL